MYDSQQAMAESLLAMGPKDMERALAGMFRAQDMQAETLARLHLLQARRGVLDGARAVRSR
jgi:hypothetical protein